MYLDQNIRDYPELFPKGIEKGYKLHGYVKSSKKMPEVSCRRICLRECDEERKQQVFQIQACNVLTYKTGYVEEVEKPLFLHAKFGVPMWGLSYVFGKDDMYWYRVSQQLGQHDLVGTTIKDATKLPKHLLADEKHTRFNGEKVYVATTVAEECVLGASVSLSASEAGLKEAYGVFQQEAMNLDPEYEPETVNTDGWAATQAAWLSLFPTITIILCFLHAFLKIRDRAKRLKDIFPDLADKVWDAYQQDNYTDFINKVSVLKLWAHHYQAQLTQAAFDAITKLCHNAHHFALAYQHPQCRRTSNMIDRHLDALDRFLFSHRYFHGHLHAAELAMRAWSLAHNFLPYCPRSKISQDFISPAHRINGFVYRDNWLENLLVSASLGGNRG